MGTSAVCVLLLALLVGVRALIVERGDLKDPIEYTGAIGEAVDAERFTVQVRGVDFANAVTGDPDDRPLRTDQVWLLVELTLTTAEDRLQVHTPVELRTPDGLTYAASSEEGEFVAGGSGGTDMVPGIPASGVAVFEVPPEHVAGAQLRIQMGELLMERLTGAAVVDLDLSAADVRGGVAAASPMVVPDSEQGTGVDVAPTPLPPGTSSASGDEETTDG